MTVDPRKPSIQVNGRWYCKTHIGAAKAVVLKRPPYCEKESADATPLGDGEACTVVGNFCSRTGDKKKQ